MNSGAFFILLKLQMKTKTIKRLLLSSLVSALVAILLTIIHIKVTPPILLLERFIPGFGWIEIAVISLAGGFLMAGMLEQKRQSKLRVLSWTVFMVVFFAQLILGLLGIEKCLMTGNLHFPIPGLIIGGAVYRLKLSFMPILYLSTILLSGPAWCSQLCYFGAADNLVARTGKMQSGKLKFKNPVKHTVLFVVVTVALLFRFFGANESLTTIAAATLGIIGLAIILVFSSRKKKMVHCTSYCPIGTLTMYLKHASLFRFKITSSCTSCMKCTRSCRYDALNQKNIEEKKIGNTCTFCGDCIPSCPHDSLSYSFAGLKPAISREIYLTITITLFMVFLATARI